jgi:DNA-binding transcriptional ArsR family regulator
LLIFNEKKLQILELLLNCDDNLCGCDLLETMDIPKNLLSYHIKTLIEQGYVQENRCGRQKKYSIRPESLNNLKSIFEVINKL